MCLADGRPSGDMKRRPAPPVSLSAGPARTSSTVTGEDLRGGTGRSQDGGRAGGRQTKHRTVQKFPGERRVLQRSGEEMVPGEKGEGQALGEQTHARSAGGLGLLGRGGAGPCTQCLLPGPRSRCGQGWFPLRPPLGLYVAGLPTLLTAPLPDVRAWPGEVSEGHGPSSLTSGPERPSEPLFLTVIKIAYS